MVHLPSTLPSVIMEVENDPIGKGHDRLGGTHSPLP